MMPLDDAERAVLLRHLPGAEEMLRQPVFSRNTERTVDAEQLAAELEGVGVEVAPVFLTFEEQFGGLEAGSWTTVGIHDALATPHGPDAAGGVPCIGGNLDWYYVLRPDGSIWFQELLAMQRPARIADRPQSFVFRYLLYATPRFAGPVSAGLQIRGHRGRAVADILGAQLVPAASDDVSRLWESKTVSILETPDLQFIVDPIDPDQPPDDITSLVCDDQDTLDEVLHTVSSHLPDLSWRPDDFADWS